MKLDDGTMVSGLINLIQRGDVENRISDIFVGREEPFVVIFQAAMAGMTNKVLVINKHHIVWVVPDEEEYTDRGEGSEGNGPKELNNQPGTIG
jgi:hypothetical protein